MAHFALIEGGGTWFRCAVATESSAVTVETQVNTTTPAATLDEVGAFFQRTGKRFDAVGYAGFGPLDVDYRSPTFGSLLTTPKPEWSGFAVARELEKRLGAPVHFHTDVVGAALGEWAHGAAIGARSVLYLTVGTGIGGGLLVDGVPAGGAQHPEMGHVSLRRERGDRFPGVCPIHGDCLEGLASGPAIAKRALRKGEGLPLEHLAVGRAMGYLAQAISNFVLTAAPDVVILGGGVMREGAALPLVRSRVLELLRSYLPSWSTEQDLDRRILSPALGATSALVGAREMIRRSVGLRRVS